MIGGRRVHTLVELKNSFNFMHIYTCSIVNTLKKYILSIHPHVHDCNLHIVLKLKLESGYCCLSAHYSTTFLDLRFLLPGTQP